PCWLSRIVCPVQLGTPCGAPALLALGMAAAGRVVQGSVVEAQGPRYVQATVVGPGQQDSRWAQPYEGPGSRWAQPYEGPGGMPNTPQPYVAAGACGAPTVIGTPIGTQQVGLATHVRVTPQGLAYPPTPHRPMGMETHQPNPYAGGSGYVHGAFDERADPPMCLAFLACLCCCPIVGLCALMKAAEVSSANARGDFQLGHIKRREAMFGG
ncbi:unnamed protein product, partial [Prorocentrum cordatum]